MDENYRYLTEVEVSQMTRIAVQTLRNDRFNRRGIPYHKVGVSGRSVRYKLLDVISYMESGRIDTSFIPGNLKTAKGGRS